MTQTVDTFFEGGVTAAKFEDRQFGTVIGGVITDDPRMTQQRDYTSGDPISYPDGNPAMQMVITVQAFDPAGEDDGKRAFYIKGQMKQAVGEALKKCNVKSPARGGKLWIKYTEDKPVTLKNNKPGNPQKIFIAKYEPPAQAAADSYFGDPPAAQASTFAAPAGTNPAATTWPACPPGVDPAAWQAMDTNQRSQMYQALGLPILQAAPPVGGSAFTDEPPF